jgi:hypothetical protein
LRSGGVTPTGIGPEIGRRLSTTKGLGAGLFGEAADGTARDRGLHGRRLGDDAAARLEEGCKRRCRHERGTIETDHERISDRREDYDDFLCTFDVDGRLICRKRVDGKSAGSEREQRWSEKPTTSFR